jgi:CDP-4-dehydro-6-deoxyglucose reductase, E1
MSQALKRVRPIVRAHFEKSRKREFIPGKTRIPLTVPTYGAEEVMESLESLLSTWVSMGKKVKRFEEMFARYLGTRHAVMVNSGSSANLLAMSVLTNSMIHDSIPPGSEVITPAVTWVTTVYPIVNAGCIPVLVDVELESYNVKPEAVESAVTSKTKAVVPVHLLGNPCKIDAIEKTARENGLFVLEDSCESTGADFHGKKVGTFGDMGTFSFYLSHHISTIEGGMVVTDDDEKYECLKAMRAFGWVRDLSEAKRYAGENQGIDSRFLFLTRGFNFRPTEIQGAFGMHQIGKLERFIDLRRRNASYWNKRLGNYRDVLVLPHEDQETRHVYFGYPITIRRDAGFTREEITQELEKKGIETRPIMAGNVAEQPVAKQIPCRIAGDLENSKLIMRNSFFFGNHNGIGLAERKYIAGCIMQFIDSVVKR